MLEALLLVVQLCLASPCSLVRTGAQVTVTVCNALAVDNNSWVYTRKHVKDGKVLIIRLSSSLCLPI